MGDSAAKNHRFFYQIRFRVFQPSLIVRQLFLLSFNFMYV